MRTPEDPCRDPASEARDDHASEPRATPETDAAVQRIRSDMRILQGDEMDELTDVCQRLERQRDELTDRWEKSANAFLIEQGKREAVERQRDGLLEACKECDEAFGKFCPDPDSRYGMAWATVKVAIAAVKGGKP